MRNASEPAEIALLEAGAEDFHGLWELPAVIRSILDIPDAEAEARRVATRLISRGFLRLVWGEPHPDERKPLTHSEAVDALSNPHFWAGDQPFTGRQVWVFTTAEGECYLQESP